MKTKKGISLIVLIVTIIVIIILSGVVILTLTGENGIITQANKAKNKTDEATEKEAIQLGYNYLKIAQVHDENANLEVEGATSVEGNSTDGWKITFESGRKYNLSSNGEFLGPWTQNGETITNADGITLKVGDYVDYDPTAGATESDLKYTSLSSKSGADNDQEFNATTYKEAGYGWRVLGVSNGKLRLISEEFVGPGTYSDANRTYYELGGQQGYINGIEELNKISAIFGHGKGAESATSITVDDINAITGYDPTKEEYYKGQFCEYGNEITFTRGSGETLSLSATNGQTWSGTPKSTFNYYDKATKSFVPLTSGSIKIKNTDYRYGPAILKMGFSKPTQGVDENGTYNDTYQMLFGKWTMKEDNGYYRNFTGTGTEPKYWLASDSIYTSSPWLGSSWIVDTDWRIRNVGNGGIESSRLYSSEYDVQSNYNGVRPVVSLKSDVTLEWNNSANEWKIKY